MCPTPPNFPKIERYFTTAFDYYDFDADIKCTVQCAKLLPDPTFEILEDKSASICLSMRILSELLVLTKKRESYTRPVICNCVVCLMICFNYVLDPSGKTSEIVPIPKLCNPIFLNCSHLTTDEIVGRIVLKYILPLVEHLYDPFQRACRTKT